MPAMHQTPNSKSENSAPKVDAHAAHPQSDIVKPMSVKSPTFSSSQEPIKDEDSLHKGRKRKATRQAVQISPIFQHEIENIHTTELPSPDFKDRLEGKITCMVCGEEGHFTCDSPMKGQEEKVTCTLCNKVGHFSWCCCRQNVSENHACQRCGEKGHYTNNKELSDFCEKCIHHREISCFSCDTNHLLGDCPMGKITCFFCEGKNHVPAQCPLSPILNIAIQYHRESLRATLNKLMTETSSGTLTSVKPSGKLPHFKAVPKVSNFSSCNGQGHSVKKNPMRIEVPDSDKTNHAIVKNKAAMLPFKIICINCHEEGHYAYGCPSIHHREISCSCCDTNHLLGDCPMGEITCFLCEGKNHVPAQCRFSPILNIATQYHRESLRAILNKLMTETSSGTVKPVKPSGKLPQFGTVTKVSNFGSNNVQGHSAKKNPMRSEVPESDKTNHATMKNKATMLPFKIICINCHEEGHYAYGCPRKKRSGELGLQDVTCPKKKLARETSSGTVTPVKPSGKLPHFETVAKVSNFSSSYVQGHSAKKNPMRSEVLDSDKTNHATMNNKAAMLPFKIICINCHEEGHYAYGCPRKKLSGELRLHDVTCPKKKLARE